MENKKFATGHVGLNVSDVEKSKKFYQKIFGFEVIGESQGEKRFVFLGYGEDILVTLWQQSESGFSKDNAGLHHLSFSVGSLEDLKSAEDALKNIGARFKYEGIVAHREGSATGGIFFEDPDGIRLEIYTAGVSKEASAPHGNAPSCGFF